MKKLSTWAWHNKWKARIIIIISWILLTFLGIYIGIILKQLNAILPAYVFIGSIIAFFIAFVIYPFKAHGKIKKAISFYAWQKSCDMIVATASFIMIVYLANKPETLFSGYQFAHAVVISRTSLPTDSIHQSYKSISDFTASMKDKNGNLLKLKERKKILKTQLTAIQEDKNMSTIAKMGLILLYTIVAIGLLGVVFSLACSLSCSGAEGAAAIVLVGGTALAIWLLVSLIRLTNGKKKKPGKPETMGSPRQ